MLDFARHEGPKPKCYFTHATLPTFVNHDQPSTRKKPFSTVLGQSFSHTLRVVMPDNGADRLVQGLSESKGKLHYARVHIKLSDVIEGDFFNQYIKSGNVLMLSEGRPGIDHIYSLSEGVLRLEVDKPTFERLGLEGKPIPSEGRKHVKARYAIELNLRLPSRVRGKPGFERIIWAFKTVLNRSVAWLFYDLKSETDGTGPIAAHQPFVRSVEAEVEHLDKVSVPVSPAKVEQDASSEATELLEWLSLVANQSPRVQSDDKIDPYLSRYRVPDGPIGKDGGPIPNTERLAILRWHGFVPASFVSKILLAALRASADGWFAISATSFSGEAYTILKTGDRTLTWEYMD